jgi:hypothetical protein
LSAVLAAASLLQVSRKLAKYEYKDEAFNGKDYDNYK